jgi:hypothetical protein
MSNHQRIVLTQNVLTHFRVHQWYSEVLLRWRWQVQLQHERRLWHAGVDGVRGSIHPFVLGWPLHGNSLPAHRQWLAIQHREWQCLGACTGNGYCKIKLDRWGLIGFTKRACDLIYFSYVMDNTVVLNCDAWHSYELVFLIQNTWRSPLFITYFCTSYLVCLFIVSVT